MTCDNLLLDLQNKDQNKDDFKRWYEWRSRNFVHITILKLFQMYLLSPNKNYEEI